MNDLYPTAILAGGLGTRLGDLTKTRPKCMVEVGGQPFIGHVLRLLRSQGARRVVLCIGHLGEQVEAFVGDGLAYGLQIQYSYDGDQQLGTAGALRTALPLLGSDFFVLYGDSYLPHANLRAMQAAYDAVSYACGLMAVCQTPPDYRPNVRLEGAFISQYGKDVDGQHIDYGIGILHQWSLLPKFSNLADIYAYHADDGRLLGYEVPGRFHTIGTPAGLAECEEFLGALV